MCTVCPLFFSFLTSPPVMCKALCTRCCVQGFVYKVLYVCMAITCSKSMDQPNKVANPARGNLNRENEYFPVPVRA